MTHALAGRGAWSPATAPAATGAAGTASPLVVLTLVAFIASIPFESPSRAIPFEVPTLTGFILLFFSLLNPSACYRRIPAPLIGFVAYLWVLLVVCVAFGVANRQLVARFFITMLQMVWLFWVLVNLFEDRRILRAVLLTFVLACAARALMQLLGIATTASTVWTGGTRVTTLGQNPNLSAIILSGGLVTMVGLALSRLEPPRWLKVAALPFGVAAGAAIIQSGSRGGLLCALAGLSIFCLRGATVGARIRNALLAAAGVVALGIGAWRSDMMRNRLEESATEGRLAGRERIYPAAVEMISERPLMGWGPIANHVEIALRIREHRLARRDPHNLVLELATSTGLLGTIPFLAGIAFAAGAAIRGRHTITGWLPVALLATALTGTISGTWIASKILWLALAVATVAPRLPSGDTLTWGEA